MNSKSILPILRQADCEINRILGINVSESEKDEFFDSLIKILQKHTKKLQNSLKINNNDDTLTISSSYEKNPSINIFFINQPMNYQNLSFNQNQYAPMIPNNSYYANNSFFQMPMIQNQQNLNICNQNFDVEQKMKANIKKKSKNHKKSKSKDKSKSKKSTSKKTKKSTSKSHQKNQSKSKILTFEFNSLQPFDGIMKYLTNQTGGNIHDNGTIDITSNSIYENQYHPKNLVEFDRAKSYCAKDGEKFFWVCFNFKNMQVEISRYSIKSFASYPHIKSWVIEISNDGENWEIIDKHENSDELNEKNIHKTFDVQKKSFAHFCRFRHTDKYWRYASMCHSGFQKIEFFGRLKMQ